MQREAQRIFVIDDDPEFQTELVSLFTRHGYEVETSDRLMPALRRIRDVRFDCLIMNVDLPEMKGYEAVPIVKTIDRRIKVIMTSNVNTLELESNIRKQDVFYYHIKSFETDELAMAVHDALRRHRVQF